MIFFFFPPNVLSVRKCGSVHRSLYWNVKYFQNHGEWCFGYLGSGFNWHSRRGHDYHKSWTSYVYHIFKKGKKRRKKDLHLHCSQPAEPERLSYSHQHWLGNLKSLIFTNSSECICFFSLPWENFTYLTVFIPSAASYPFVVCSQVSH